MKETKYGYAFVAPCIAVIIFVLGFPMLFVIGISFTEYLPMISVNWVGLENYIDVMKTPVFWQACKNTFVFTIYSVVFHVLLGMGAALLLNREFKGRRLVRILYLLPWMLSYVVGAITWKWLLNGSYGMLNEMLLRMGAIDANIAWLGDPKTAMPFVILANVWKQFPFVMLMFIAGLQSIPKEQYEAAWIDRANGLQCFFHITLPNMKGVIIITSTLDFIWAFKQFDLIHVMTGGGPGTATEVLSSLVYQTFFSAFDFGQASATAIILLLIVMVISLFYARLVFSKQQAEQ